MKTKLSNVLIEALSVNPAIKQALTDQDKRCIAIALEHTRQEGRVIGITECRDAIQKFLKEDE